MNQTINTLKGSPIWLLAFESNNADEALSFTIPFADKGEAKKYAQRNFQFDDAKFDQFGAYVTGIEGEAFNEIDEEGPTGKLEIYSAIIQ